MIDSLHQQKLSKRIAGRNLFLIGMMGSGKSSTGPELAKALQYRFLDSDNVIETAVNKTISDIFRDDGEEAFREIETQVLKGIGQHHSLVIATGGGVVMRSENWGILHQGIVIWLDVEKKRLIERMNVDKSNRPLLLNDEFSIEFQQILDKREPLYLEADLRISIKDESPIQVAQLIIEKLLDILKSPDDPTSPQTIG